MHPIGNRRLFWLVFAVSLLVHLGLPFTTQSVGRDASTWDYISQVIARGGVPYRDVVNIKTPLSAYLGAASIWLLRPLLVSDVIALRLGSIVLASLTVAFTLLMARRYALNRSHAALAAAILLGLEAFARANIMGVQPKTPMTLFGLVALWAILEDRPWMAGIAAMLSALCWQPGLLYFGTALFCLTHCFTRWKDGRGVRVVLGALLPLGCLLALYWWTGALSAFYEWCFHYNYAFYGPAELRSPDGAVNHFLDVLHRKYGAQSLFFLLAIPGFVLALREERRASGASLAAVPRYSLFFPPLSYLAFCLLNMQGGPDLIPFLPFVAIFSARALLFATESLGAVFPRPIAPRIRIFGTGLVWGGVIGSGLFALAALRPVAPTLEEQRVEVAEIISHLGPGDTIFVHSVTEILELSGLTNASEHLMFDRDKDLFLAELRPGGFDAWFDELRASRPKIVALSWRLGKIRPRDRFERWVASEYTLRRRRLFAYYLRNE